MLVAVVTLKLFLILRVSKIGECSVAIRNFLNMRLLRALTGVN